MTATFNFGDSVRTPLGYGRVSGTRSSDGQHWLIFVSLLSGQVVEFPQHLIARVSLKAKLQQVVLPHGKVKKRLHRRLRANLH